MKAFVGHSFDDRDTQLVEKIIKFLESAGIKCQTGEKAQNKSIAGKIKEWISENDIFVGIFTCDREIVFSKGVFSRLNRKNRFYTTSNWVIQESGYAIGKDRELIFLVEEGIYKFPELQGDLEVIYFNRESLEKPFIKLNQMIDCIKNKTIKGVSNKTEERMEDLEKQEETRQTDEIKKNIRDKREEAFDHLYNAMFKEEDSTKVQKVYEKELQGILSNDEKPHWKAVVLRISHKLGDSDAFRKLVTYSEENQGNPQVIWQLALRYKEMREYKKAKEKFLAIKDLYDIEEESDKENIINSYEQASLCLAFDGEFEEAIKILSELLNNNLVGKYRAKILAILAQIAKIKDDSEMFFVYAEGSLDLDPSNTDLRFDLAYRYSNNGYNKLSLLHYKKVTDTKKSPMGLNNLGVQYETLNLSAKSIESYLKAAEYKETLAMANITQRYLKEGFIKDASEQIKKANELAKDGVEVHGNIGSAQNKLSRIIEEEDAKEREILIEAEKERKFRVKYSEVFYCNVNVVKEKFEGSWETPWGDVILVFDSESSSFKIDEKKKVKLPMIRTLLTGASGEEHWKTVVIKIEGKITKMSGKYKVGIEDVVEYKYISPRKEKVYEADGFMVIHEDFKIIDIMEKDKEEKLKTYIWKRK